MPHRLPPPPRTLRAALLVLRTGALSLVVLAGLWAPAYDEGSGSAAVAGEQPGQVQRLIDRHDCSTTGFEATTPLSALVRGPDGRLRLVAFERGLFTLARAGSVVAVCLDQPPVHGTSYEEWPGDHDSYDVLGAYKSTSTAPAACRCASSW